MIGGSGWGLVASVVFKTTVRRIASWVGSIPMHSRHLALGTPMLEFVILRFAPALRRTLWGAATALVVCVPLVHAQRADSVRVGVFVPARDTTKRNFGPPTPPLSPRRAFLYSLLAPGFAQSKLGRPTAGAIFVFSESVGIAMLRESAADLKQARRFSSPDSLVVLGVDSDGKVITRRAPYGEELIKIRRGHVEDWIAFLFGNHLFAAADAYVAAHLWDLPSQINVSQTSAGTVVAARVRW